MNDNENSLSLPQSSKPFFDQENVIRETIPVSRGIPLGYKIVKNKGVNLGGAYGTWGECYDNRQLADFVEYRLGKLLGEGDRLDLSSLGFDVRHHIADLNEEQHLEVEVAVGARFLVEAGYACGWEPEEIDAVLIGTSGPISEDYLERIASRAGIPEKALKVSVHKACDGSMGALNLALNPGLGAYKRVEYNFAEELRGKKVLVGGIEGLSRFVGRSKDKIALQMFGNGAGVMGVIPGETMQFLVGKDHENYDEEGVLAVRMYYPHSRKINIDGSMLELSKVNEWHFRVAGMMHEPKDDSPLAMAGPMGMVKLFVRTGVDVVRDVYQSYRSLMDRIGQPDKNPAVAIVHHANLKINQLKEKHLNREGIHLPMPWLLREFGNVSAASNIIAFLRQLPNLRPGDHVLFDGFGAGTYYDVLAVALAGTSNQPWDI